MKKVMIISLCVIVTIVVLLIVFNLGKQSAESKYSSDSQNSLQEKESNLKENNASQAQYKNTQGAGCSGSGTINFTASPRPLEQLAFIEPMGLMTFQHITPIDHGYFYPFNWKPEPSLEDLKDVAAPADGIITEIQRMPDYFKTTSNQELKDYRIILKFTCTFYAIYIHIYQLSPEIEQKVSDLEPSKNRQVNIPVKAGEVIGKANAFDFSVHNEDITLKGFLTPSLYDGEPWKIHTVDPFDYFTEPLRSELLAKSLRTATPLGGKIDYDIDEKLIGNWFVENTNGYRGNKQPEYWETHFAIAPNALDPEHFIISIGNFPDHLKQFAAKGNSPAPEQVTKETGSVKYELVDFDYIAGNQVWDRKSLAQGMKVQEKSEVKGTLLLQLIENRKLKLEAFPGKTSSQVSGFTSNALIYER